ncbi:hypothetical protein [Egbenema bharatensis]|uniref:hypothetical protein n=1 Tax=Egbenema bharatensis TaxID=3463334 RepID=UPI003A87F75F
MNINQNRSSVSKYNVVVFCLRYIMRSSSESFSMFNQSSLFCKLVLFKLALFSTVISLTACANNSPPQNSTDVDSATASETAVNSPAEPNASTTSAEASVSTTDHSAPAQGGQVVETGKYHMEFVPLTEADGVHLDFYLQTGDDHTAIADADVTAQVQLPDGTQQELPMEYDAAGEHYFAFLPSQATGEYRVVVLTDINGEKANGRFAFTK